MADSLRPVGTKTIFGLLALGWRASRSSGVSRGEGKMKFKGKHEVRRRWDDAELMADSLRPVGTKTIFGLLALGWRASRSSGVSRAKAK
jgi:hypothetical protein